jgi:hypothetical protein
MLSKKGFSSISTSLFMSLLLGLGGIGASGTIAFKKLHPEDFRKHIQAVLGEPLASIMGVTPTSVDAYDAKQTPTPTPTPNPSETQTITLAVDSSEITPIVTPVQETTITPIPAHLSIKRSNSGDDGNDDDIDKSVNAANPGGHDD